MRVKYKSILKIIDDLLTMSVNAKYYLYYINTFEKQFVSARPVSRETDFIS